MSDDPWDDPQTKRWASHVREKVAPMVRDVNAFLALAPQGEPDIKFCVELGLGIMYDKPIIVVARERKDVPSSLWMIAEAVLVGDMDDPKFQAKIAETIKGVSRGPEG